MIKTTDYEHTLGPVSAMILYWMPSDQTEKLESREILSNNQHLQKNLSESVHSRESDLMQMSYYQNWWTEQMTLLYKSIIWRLLLDQNL